MPGDERLFPLNTFTARLTNYNMRTQGSLHCHPSIPFQPISLPPPALIPLLPLCVRLR